MLSQPVSGSTKKLGLCALCEMQIIGGRLILVANHLVTAKKTQNSELIATVHEKARKVEVTGFVN